MKRQLIWLVTIVALLLSVGPLASAEEEPYKIGFFSPTTGFAAADGTSALHAAQLAVQFINGAGGVKGHPLELVYYDDAVKPDQAVSIAKKLIEEDQVVAAVSGSYSSSTRAAAPVFQDAGMVMVAAYAIHPDVTAAGDKIFRVGTPAVIQGGVGAELAINRLGAKRIAILTMDNDFGVSLVEGFKARVEKIGGVEIVLEEKFPLGEEDFRPLIGKVKAAEPDVLYATGYYAEAANLVSQAADEGLEVQIVGQEGYDSPKFIELAGEAAEGVIITTDLDRDSNRQIVQRFLSEYEAAYGLPADMVGASAFDAVQVVAYALQVAGPDPEAMAAAIAGLHDFQGAVSGPFYSYTEGRDVVRPITSQIVEGGAFHLYAEFNDLSIISPFADEPYKLGFFSPTTGFAAADGTSALHAAQLAVQFINGAGGVKGHPLELVYYDDAVKPDQAVSIAKKLIEEDQVVAAVSGSYSSSTRAAAPVFQDAGMVMVAAYAIHPDVTAAGDKIFRVGTPAVIQGGVGAELAINRLGAKRIAILTMDNDFGVSLVEGFKARVEKIGGVEIVLEEKFPLGEEDFRPLIGKVKAAEPDVLYATGYYAEAANLVSQAADEGLEVQIVGQEGYDSPKFIELAGEAAEGVIITTDLDRDSNRQIVQRFLSEYEAAYGLPADMVGASAFDAVQVVAYALRMAGPDPEAMAAAIAGLKDFQEVATGPFMRYTEGRDVVRSVTSQIVDGGAFHFYAEFTDPDLITP